MTDLMPRLKNDKQVSEEAFQMKAMATFNSMGMVKR